MVASSGLVHQQLPPISMYIYIHMYVYIHKYVHIYVHIYICRCMYLRISEESESETDSERGRELPAAATTALLSGFKLQGSGFRVQSYGLRFHSLPDTPNPKRETLTPAPENMPSGAASASLAH